MVYKFGYNYCVMLLDTLQEFIQSGERKEKHVMMSLLMGPTAQYCNLNQVCMRKKPIISDAAL